MNTMLTLTLYAMTLLLQPDQIKGTESTPQPQVEEEHAPSGTQGGRTVHADRSRDADLWMTYQYLRGDAERAPEMLDFYLSTSIKDIEDEDDRQHAVTLMIIFLGQLGREHPELLDNWAQAATKMSARAQHAFAYSVWIADPKNSKARIATIVDSMPKDDEHLDIDVINNLPEKEPPELKSLKPSSGATLDYWWVSFMATGDTEYVGRILTALPPRELTYDQFNPGNDFMAIAVAGSAIWSLKSNASRHPRVLSYLKETRAAHVGTWPVLDEVISEAEASIEEVPVTVPGESHDD